MKHFVVAGLGWVLFASVAWGQQVTVTVPSTSVQSRFSERIGVGFNVNHPNFSLRVNNGRAGSGLSGSGAPLGGASVDIPFRSGKANGNLSIFAGQEFSQTVTTTAPMLTVTNGVPGFMFGGTVQPFVTRLTPVVGAGPQFDQPTAVSPVQAMLMRGDIRLQKDPTGDAQLVVPEPPRRRTVLEPERSKTDRDSSSEFRRAMEKYTSPKK